MYKVYIAGKVKKDSSFGTHHWRDAFCEELEKLSGIQLQNLDPLKAQDGDDTAWDVFAKDCRLINEADVLIVYLSDDISVGGSQEILIAKYLNKPVIGLAPHGGKFNGARREMLGKVIEDYKDPFVYTTCDIVCADIAAVATALTDLGSIVPKTMSLVDEALAG